MQIITLNIWGGRAGRENLLAFFEKYKNVDVFCLQEVWSAPYDLLTEIPVGGVSLDFSKIMAYALQDISKILIEHNNYFRPLFESNYGLLIFVKKSLEVIEEGEIYVYKDKGFVSKKDYGDHARSIQYVTLNTSSGPLTIINFHGLWNGKGKGDTDDRILQSENIIKFLKTIKNPMVFCGDFNLTPETKSLQAIEKELGLRNLISEFKIESTRTSFYTKPIKYADYIFTTPTLNVNEFKVLPEEVSDHSALYLDITI